MVGGPIGNDEYVLERARVILHEGGTDHLARCLANMPDKQAAVHAGGQTTGRSGHMIKSSDCRAHRRHSRSSRRGARMSG